MILNLVISVTYSIGKTQREKKKEKKGGVDGEGGRNACLIL